VKNQGLIFIIVICTISYKTYGQKGEIAGSVFSSSSNNIITPVAFGATIKLLDKDSILVRSILTDSLGNFSFNDLPAGTYILQAEALSYVKTIKSVRIQTTKRKGIHDTIFLQPTYENLQPVVVTAKRPEVAIKSDTTEFRAASFKTQKNATLEDVFKKMPGVELSKDGSMKAEGETVTQIYVDSKPFFGTDLKAVMQNFPADVIDKIQIIDKKSDQAQATKVDDGVHEKIINITLKKNRNKGVFGKDYIGYGTDGRYEAKGNTNFFNNDKKFSVIIGANNTGRNDGRNDKGYNSNGIADKKHVKINYAARLGKKFDFSTWVGCEQNTTNIEQVINRRNIFSDSSIDYLENNKSGYLTKSVYGGLYFEYKPDTLTLIRFNESIGYSNNSYHSSSVFNSTAFSGYKLNTGLNEGNGSYQSPALNGQVSYSHRLSNSGRNIFLNFSNAINSNQNNIYNYFNNYFYPLNGTSYGLLLKQLQYNNNENKNFGTTISYSEPVAPNNTLNFSYTLNYGANDMPREVYDFDVQTSLYDLLNDSLSSHFKNNTNSSTAALNYNYSSKKNGFGIGMRWKQSLTQSHSFFKDSTYEQNFTGFLPSLSFFSVGKGRRLNIYYSLNVKAPQAYQLQPVIDNTNPLYTRLGNPDLKYALVQTVQYNFNYYNAKREKGFNSNANFSTVSNNISNSIIFDNITGRQISRPINTNGAYYWNAWLSYFEPVHIGNDKIKWNLNLASSGSKIVNQLNGEENISRNNFIRLFFGLTYDTPEWIDLHTEVSMSRQISEYSLQPDMSNKSYYLNISPNLTLKPVNKTEINIDYDYRQTTGQALGFNTSANMLNASIVQYFNNKKDMWVMLKAYNIFNQNTNTWRTYGDNFIQDTKVNGLSRFLLLSFNFSLNKFNNKKEGQLPSSENKSDL
jgi:hypothetical protein